MSTARPDTIGVGILGAGPVVQAIHLPTLARLSDRLTVTHIMDVAADVAESVAGRVGASSSTSLESLLADPNVEIVAICSPSQFHASQVIAAMRAGKRAVLCEKPFATTRDEAEEIAAVSAETGVPVIVGAMHTFDPAWTEARKAWGDLPDTAHTIRSSIVLPPNPRFEDRATEVVSRTPFPSPGEITPEVLGAMMSGGVLGLAIHDLPLVRSFLGGQEPVVTSAKRLDPFGYAITLRAGERIVELIAAMHSHWKPAWEFDVIADDQTLHIDFTPSYVHAGSGTARLHRSGEPTRVFGDADHNGYEGEWRALHAHLIQGTPIPARESLIDDLTLAVSIADQASAFVIQEAQR
jgi:myo-inositol 2-dehydrogenase / D-chiro-inositol 1-dehydrogenase